MAFRQLLVKKERKIRIFADRNYMNPWGILTGIRPVKIASKLLREGLSEEEAVKYFINEYKAAPDRARLALDLAKTEIKVMDNMYADGVSLYIGIPFCPTRCLYCSFISNSVKSSGKYMEEYVRCLKKEIEYTSNILKERNVRIETVYIGGGTPTTLSHTQLEEIFAALYKFFDLKDLKEFTVEAGRPDTITREKLDVINAYEIDRISINPQTMNLKTLETIGRNHTPEDIIRAYELARKCGIKIINMDVIAGLPGESFEDFKYTLEEVEKLSPENTTVHTMSIKRSSRLNELIESYNLTEDDTVFHMVEFSKEYMASVGKNPYYLYRQKNMLGNLENIGYTKKDFESIYNIYIMEELQSIISMGCGGVTKTVEKEFDRIERIFNVKEPKEYIERFEEMLKRKDILKTRGLL